MAFYESASFVPDISVGYLLRVTHQLSVAGLDHVFADEGMTAVQWQALLALNFGAASTCVELARHLSYDKGAMTRLVDQMEASGWIARQRDADDRRVIRLEMTEEGQAAARRCKERVLECWNSWLADWSHEEIAGLVAVLQKLRATLSEATA
jgi:DNA-binding MarR family transcriptional regulator